MFLCEIAAIHFSDSSSLCDSTVESYDDEAITTQMDNDDITLH